AMDLMLVAVRPQGVDVSVGHPDLQDFFTGEVGWQTSLPELMFAFDLALGLGRGGVTQADVIELEGPAQLCQGVRVVCEEDAVVIDIELEGAAVGHKGGWQKVKVGK